MNKSEKLNAARNNTGQINNQQMPQKHIESTSCLMVFLPIKKTVNTLDKNILPPYLLIPKHELMLRQQLGFHFGPSLFYQGHQV